MREENTQLFTQDMLEKMAYIWSRSSIALMDVRHRTIYPDQPLRHYTMPGSMLVFAYGGSADVQLNEALYSMERFGLFHGGKGTTLSITPEETALTSYMALYKAETPPFFKKDLQRLLEQVNPFVLQFGYAPSNPVGLLHLFGQMMDSWSRTSAMSHFYAKNMFYQSIYEMYKDLEQEQTAFLQPDLVAAAKRYLDEHYMKPIMFQEMADMFAISSGQLTRLFKKREGTSLQEYAIRKRLDDALRRLGNTNASVKEIATGSGFTDERNFFRIFKKHFKLTPLEYRKIKRQSMQECTIDNDYHNLYNEIGLEHLAKSQRDGEFSMFGQTRSKQMIVAAVMSLMLLLSACGAAPATTHNGAGTHNASTPAATTAPTPGADTQVAQWPRTLEDARGVKVTITEKPARIAVTTWLVTENLMALDTPPIAADTVEMLSEWASMKDYFIKYPVESLGEGHASISLEKLLELQPDLILATTANAEIYDQLERIAPLFVFDSGVLFSNWQNSIRSISQVVGSEQAADTFIADTLQQVDLARQQVGSLDQTFAFVSVVNGGFSTFSTDQLAMYYDAKAGVGLPVPPGWPEKGESISLEAFSKINPDYIFISGEDDPAFMEQLNQNAVWKSLTAVKNNHVHPIDLSGLTGGPLAVKYGVGTVLEAIHS